MIRKVASIFKDQKSLGLSRDKIIERYNKYGIYIILLALVTISAIIQPVFLSRINIINVMSQIAVTTIVACGITMLIISTLTDLSAGSVVALTGCICVGTYLSLTKMGLSLAFSGALSVLLAVIVGILVNLISGLIITTYNAPPFIVTLAMMMAARGVVFIYTDGSPIYNVGKITIIGQGKVGDLIPYSVCVTIIIVMITWVILNQTRFGRYLYAIGGNIEAAIASGIDVKRTMLLAFLIHGAFVGIAGVIFMTRIASGQPAEAVGLEFDSIIAAIIGGTSFAGGIGTIGGTIAGCIMIGVINNILNLMFVQVYWQHVIKGMIIMLAVVLDIVTKGGAKR